MKQFKVNLFIVCLLLSFAAFSQSKSKPAPPPPPALKSIPLPPPVPPIPSKSKSNETPPAPPPPPPAPPVPPIPAPPALPPVELQNEAVFCNSQISNKLEKKNYALNEHRPSFESLCLYKLVNLESYTPKLSPQPQLRLALGLLK